MTKPMNDAEFTERMLGRFVSAPTPAPVTEVLEAKIMADFDAVMARPGWRERCRATLAAAFPGLAPWQPALAFAAALMIGGIGGALLPAAGLASTPPGATATQVVQIASADESSFTDSGIGTALAMAGEME